MKFYVAFSSFQRLSRSVCTSCCTRKTANGEKLSKLKIVMMIPCIGLVQFSLADVTSHTDVFLQNMWHLFEHKAVSARF